MKLIRLYIKDHLLLHELNLRFDRDGRLDEKESYRLDFLVGVNGSGKSILLRTLVEIFTSLQTGEGAEFCYELEYELETHQGVSQKILGNRVRSLARDFRCTKTRWVSRRTGKSSCRPPISP